MMYCRLVSELGMSLSRVIFLASCSETPASREYRTHMQSVSDKVAHIDLGPLKSGRPSLSYQWALLARIKAITKKHPDADVLVLEGDKFVLPLALHSVATPRLSVLVMRAPGSGAGTPRARLLTVAKKLGIWLVQRRGVDVKVLAPAMRSARSYSFRGYPAAPDPVELTWTKESVNSYRSSLGLSPARRWVGVFGHVTKRKNLDLVAEAVANCGAKQYGLLVAGVISDEERARCSASLKRLTDQGGEVVFDSRLLSDEELDSAIASVDVVAIAHTSEGPSGIFGKAIASGVGVAAAGATSLREDVERLGIGEWSKLNPDDYARALRSAGEAGSRQTLPRLANGNDFASAVLTRPTVRP